MFIQTQKLEDPALMIFTPGEPVLPTGGAKMGEAAAADSSPLAQRLLCVEGIEGVSLDLNSLTLRKDPNIEWYLLKPSVLGSIMEFYASGEPLLADEVEMKLFELLEERIRPAVEGYGGEVLFKKLADDILTLELIGGGGAQKRSMMTNIITHHIPEIKDVTWVGTPEAPEIPDWVFNGSGELPTGPEADAVIRLLDEKINPAVAAHGGKISLIDITDHVAYVRMEGGCQGCSASAVTLQRGVQNAILSEVSTIQGVIDVTDHSTGVNPFYS